MAKKLPTVITREEFDKLLERAKKLRESYRMKRSKKLRDRGTKINQYIMAMCLAFGAGLRISEIIGLPNKYEPLSFRQIENNMIRITGKGQKDRMTLLPIKIFRSAGITREDLKNNLPLSIKRRSLQHFIETLTFSVLGKRKSFHKLRHGFGTTLAGAGRPLHEIQMLMGHSRLDTTGIYLHANPKQATDAAQDAF